MDFSPRSTCVRKRTQMLFYTMGVIGLGVRTLAYNTDTHRALTLTAFGSPKCQVDAFLKNDLLFPGGIHDGINGKELAEYAAFGAEAEDEFGMSPFPGRFMNHFYNPMQANPAQRGLYDTFFGIWIGPRSNSMSWGWNGDGNANEWSWLRAREYYYNWLTLGEKARRNDFGTHMFRSVGQFVHLTQDLAQPQHTRNDAHGPNDGNPYERYCSHFFGRKDQVMGLDTEPLPHFSYGTLDADANYVAGIPRELRAFWDTGQLRTQHFTTGRFRGFTSAPGLAEYSNAYFVTDETMFTNADTVVMPGLPAVSFRLQGSWDRQHTMPYPRLQDTDITRVFNRGRVTLVRVGEELLTTEGDSFSLFNGAYSPSAQTVVNDLFSVNTRLGENPRIGLTLTNFASHAEHLLPKALSYSEGVLNYFFRGRFEVKQEFDEANFRNVLRIKNLTVNPNGEGEPLRGGQFTLYRDDTEGNRTPVEGFDTSEYSGTLAPGAELKVYYPAKSEPLNTEASQYTLVFKGTIGNEKDTAVAAKRFEGIVTSRYDGTFYFPPHIVTPFSYCRGANNDPMNVVFHKLKTRLWGTVEYDSAAVLTQFYTFDDASLDGSSVTFLNNQGELSSDGRSITGTNNWICPLDQHRFSGTFEIRFQP